MDGILLIGSDSTECELCKVCSKLESLLVLYNCLLQIIIVEFRHFVRGVWVSHRMLTTE